MKTPLLLILSLWLCVALPLSGQQTTGQSRGEDSCQFEQANGAEASFLGALRGIEEEGDALCLTTNLGQRVYIRLLQHQIVQVSYLPKGAKALLPGPALAVPIQGQKFLAYEDKSGRRSYDLGKGYRMEVRELPLRLAFFLHDSLLMKEEKSFFLDKTHRHIGLRLRLQDREGIYGCGEDALSINRRKTRMLKTPHMPFRDEDKLFFLSSRGYGVLIDHHKPAWLDIGQHEREVLEFGTCGVQGLSYYFIPGEPLKAIEAYSWLTGSPREEAISDTMMLFYPYNYSLTWQNQTKGWPIIRPLFFHHPHDAKSWQAENGRLWGRDLLLMPESDSFYLPPGQWMDFFKPDTILTGGKKLPKAHKPFRPG